MSIAYWTSDPVWSDKGSTSSLPETPTVVLTCEVGAHTLLLEQAAEIGALLSTKMLFLYPQLECSLPQVDSCVVPMILSESKDQVYSTN